MYQASSITGYVNCFDINKTMFLKVSDENCQKVHWYMGKN